MLSWIGFFLAIAVLLAGSRVHLGLSLFAGGIALGIFTIPPSEILNQIYLTLTDPSVVVLTAAMTMIPIIAGILQKGGKLDQIVENLRIGKKAFLGMSPSLLGLLPIPGGALFSAPLIERAGEGLGGGIKTGINIWFRHILFFVYPLAPALIVPANIAGLSVYRVIVYQFPFLFLTIGLGYLFFLRGTKGEMSYERSFSFERLILPLSVLLVPPILDFSLQTIFEFSIEEISTLIAISCSLLLAVYIVDSKRDVVRKSVNEMEPWNFTLIILGIYVFINIFKSSGIGGLIASLSPSPIVLSLGFGFFLGVVTGRIILPASIIIPIYLGTFSLDSLPPVLFALTYFAIFMGYVITPIHPCVGLSLKYFDADIGDFLKGMAIPVAISMVIAVVLFVLLVG